MRGRIQYHVNRVLNPLLRLLPVEVFVRRPHHHYVPDLYGHSAFKHLDIRELQPFGDLARTVMDHGNTMMYYDKLYFIYQAIANLQRAAETGSGEIGLAEAGVYKGGTCYFMAAAAEALGMKKLSVHAFDTFEGHHPQDVDPEHAHLQPAGAFANVDYEAVKQYLRRFEGAEVHKGRFQDTCSAVAHRKFHVVHLDINLYDPTLCALQFFDERLVRGGTIVVDDYGSLTNPGVRKAVDDFLPTTTEYFKVHLLTNQCLLMKTGPAGGHPVEAPR